MFIGLEISGRQKPDRSKIVVTVGAPVITNSGALSGATIGTETTIAGVAYTGDDVVLTYQWFLGGAPIAGAASAAYTPQPADDLGFLRARVTATNGIGSPAVQFTPGITVRYPAPVVSGTIADQIHDEGDGPQVVDGSAAFTGSDLTYSITAGQDAASINASTGQITVLTDTVLSLTSVTVEARNSGGAATVDFDVEVQAAPPTASGTIPAQTFTKGDTDRFLDVSGYFSGSFIVYSINVAADVATIDPVLGVIAFATDAGRNATVVTVTATNNGGSATRQVTFQVDVPAPVPNGIIANVAFQEGSGLHVIQSAPRFSGEVDSYSIAPDDSGWVSIDENTGAVTVDSAAPRSGTSFTVTAANFGGSATRTFTASVYVAPPVVAGSIQNQTFTVGQGSGSVDVDVAGVITGSGVTLSVSPSGAGVTVSGTTVTVDTSSLIPQANYSLIGTNASGQASVPFLVAVNDAAPVVVGSPGAQSFTLGSGDQDVDLTSYVLGENLAWTRAAGGTWASIGPTGVASFNTDQIRNSVSVSFDATNSGGFARVTFAVSVAPEAPVKLSDVPALVFSKGATATYDLSQHVSGLDLTYTRTGAQGFISSVNPSTGLASFNTSAAGGPTGQTVVAANATGSVSLTFTVEVRIVAPVATGTIPDQTFDHLSGQRTVQAAPYFSGEAITYSITAGGPTATVNATTGAITLKDDVILEDFLITVRATNASGFAERSFLLTITEVVSGEIRVPNGGVIGMRAGLNPGAVIVCWNEPTFWGDVSAGDGAGTAGNLRVTVGGEEYYMMDGPPIPNAEIEKTLVVNFSAPDSDIPIDTVRGLPVGSGAVGETVVIGATPASLDNPALDGSVCNRWILPAALHGQTIPVTFVWYNAEGVETDPVTVDITTEAVSSVPANALLHPVNDNYLSLPDSDTDLLLHPVD